MSFDIQGQVLALNFHVWQPCNMGCQYCFAEFSEAVTQLQADKRHLRERALSVIGLAAKAGIQKLTLVGGEPTLCPWLLDLLQLGKRLGLVTMVVSNGSRMSDAWVAKHAPWTDWAALSIDSLDGDTNRSIGRVTGRAAAPDDSTYSPLLKRLRLSGCRIKVNTVVSAQNWQEDFTSFLMSHEVERWKVLQALHVSGENDDAFPHMAVSESQFAAFVERHQRLKGKLMLAAEDNESMRGSYLMVDPLGRFFSNVRGGHHYSEPIWKVGWDEARGQVDVDAKKFVQRGGQYDWSPLAMRHQR